MRARMNQCHRRASFGPHLLENDQIIATEGDEGFPVSADEMAHHLNAGHADAIRAPALEVTAPPPMETAESPPPNGPGVRPPEPEAVEPDPPEAEAPPPAAAKKPARRRRGRPRKS